MIEIDLPKEIVFGNQSAGIAVAIKPASKVPESADPQINYLPTQNHIDHKLQSTAQYMYGY